MDGVMGELVVEGPPFWQAIFWIGVLVMVLAGVWMLLEAFGESVAWGVCLILIPISGLVFTVVHWSRARGPFVATLAAWGLILLPQKFAEPAGIDDDPAAESDSDSAGDTGDTEAPAGYSGGAVYRYRDRFGRVHITNDLSSIPAEYRGKVEPLYK